MSDKIPPPDQLCDTLGCTTSENSGHGQGSPFLQLPAELRISIYDIILIEGQSGSVICTWQSSLGISFETNLYIQREQGTGALSTPDLIGLAINKQIYKEACKEFYTKRTFRFNTEQVGRLLQCPGILNYLRCIEIEDMMKQRHLHDLEPMLKTLSAAENMDKIFMGTLAVGYDDYTLRYSITPTNTSPRTTSVFGKVLDAFSQSRESHTVRLPMLPKVFFVNFHRRGGERARELLDRTIRIFLNQILGND